MHTKNSNARIVVRPLALALAAAIAGTLAGTAHAVEFGTEDGWHGSLNTTLSYGVSFRVADQDPDLIAKAHYDPLIGLQSNAAQRAAKGAFSANHDDGDLNYSNGSAFSNAVKATTELSINHGNNFGGFFRASAFYDFANANNDKLTDLAQDQVGSKLRMLDAFVFGKFTINDQQGQVRFGRQVLSWGESTFIQGGINSINPVDVSQLHVAGAELKEALLPVNMLWGTYNFTSNFSVEATYLLHQLIAILTRHPDIAHEHVRHDPPQSRQRLDGGTSRRDDGARILEQAMDDIPCIFFVLHDQHAHAGEDGAKFDRPR